MKSHIKLFTTVLQEAGQYCGVNTSRDMLTVTRRLAKEGESFLTITLPTYEKDLLQALDRGRISSDLFVGFQHSGGFPKLFSGFLRKIFADTGELRPTSEQQVAVIRCLRQVLLLLSKIELECSPDREGNAILAYQRTDDELDTSPESVPLRVQVAFRELFSSFLNEIERELLEDPIFRGNHGPGAVADHSGNNARWAKLQWTTRLEAVLPAESTLACNLHDYMDQQYEWLTEEQEPPVRVVTVPKTMKGPRVIAIEPAHMQYVQQGLFKLFTRILGSPHFAPLNATMGWMDQEPNRRLSRDWHNYATIDLSEASDRVSLALVQALFEPWPLTSAILLASRSERAKLPSGEIVTLKKFASMGSAMCFPVESMVFAAIAVAAKNLTDEDYGRFHSHRAGWDAVRIPFRVFGDDIVVPKDWTPNLLAMLSLCGLKVNTSKSFWTGMFRESCGADWYAGYDVSVVKVRKTITPNRQDVESIIRGISLHNRLFERGWFKSAKAVEDSLNAVRPMPYAPAVLDVHALWTYDFSKCDFRTNKRLQAASIRAFSLRYKYREDMLDGYGALRKYFAGSDEYAMTPWDYDVLRVTVDPKDPEHLRRAGRPVHVAMTVRYVAFN